MTPLSRRAGRVIRWIATILAASVCTALAAQSVVPDVGSTWESTLEYAAMPTDNGHGLIRRASETATVVRMVSGRPVFAGEVFGYRGEIVESSAGTVVYTDDCRHAVPADMLHPPAVANQCVWHVCKAPAVGQTFSRPMVFYAPLFGCTPQTATYSFTATHTASFDGHDVTVGDAKVYFSPFRQTAWRSFVRDGIGEVYGESPGRRTTYTRVAVRHVAYAPPASAPPRTVARVAPSTLDRLPQTCEFMAFGDSLTEGLGAAREDAYPAQLSRFFGKTICNLGISGNTTEIALARLPAVLALRPKVVFISLGANDALQGIEPQVTAKNLAAIVDGFRAAEVLVVLLGLEGVASSLPSSVRVMLAACKGIEDKEGVVVLPDAFVGVLDDKASLSSDGIHPNARGYRQLARNILDQGFAMLHAVPVGPLPDLPRRQ